MHQDKHIRIKGVRREVNIKKLSRALIALAQAQAEKEAAAKAADAEVAEKKVAS